MPRHALRLPLGVLVAGCGVLEAKRSIQAAFHGGWHES